MAGFLGKLVGPRVPSDQLRAHPWRFALPTMVFTAARVLLLVSIFFPYWHMDLDAPQYPDGLYLTAYVHHLEGDVKEIDGLNHYIGMRPLNQAATFERAAAIWFIIAMVLLVEGAAYVHSRYAVLLAVPAVLFPVGFLADLQYWLATFGQNLDPDAPLSSSVKPFVPTILGDGGIGQFKTYSEVGIGFWMALAAGGLLVVGFFFHRRAYKPLVEASRGGIVAGVA
jgi:copper chaperone NosL